MTEQQIKRLGEDKLRTIYNNIKATHNMVNIQQVKGKDLEIVDVDKYDYLMTYSFPCSLAGTKIFTSDGYKNVEDVTTDDFVLTHNNRFCKVAKTMTRISDHYYKLKGLGVPELYLTEEHPLYVYRDGKLQWVKVKDLKLSDKFSFNINKNSIKTNLSKSHLWLLGRYVADGHINKRLYNSIEFSINFDKEDEFLQKIPREFKIRFKKFKKSCWEYRIADADFQKICKQFGNGALNKCIPQWVIDLPCEDLQAFFDGYISGDGHIRHRGSETQIMFSTVSESLFLGMQQIVAKLYRCLITCSIRHDNRKASFNDAYNCQFNLTPHHRDQFVYKDKICTKIKHIEKFDEDVPVYNFEVESDNSYTCQNVIVHNCQDLSLAGLGKGMSADSDTRSSLLWQVGRILDECKELNHLPNVLLLENVPQVHGTKNIADFNIWIEKLNSLGYTSDWADLNTKNYGVPQNRNRTFMISRLNTTQHFNFPKPITLINKLKDLLEDEVDEKYYLSDTIVSKLKIGDEIKEKTGVDLNDRKSELREITSTIKARYDCGYEHFTPGPTGVVEPTLNKVCNDSSDNNFNAVYNESGVARTLLARDYKDPMRVATELKQIGQMYPSSGNPQAGGIYTKDGLSPCLDTCTGGNREVKILEEPFICASRGRNSENPNCRDKGQELEQRLEPKFDGTSNCLTTVTKDNYVCEPTCTPLQKEVCNKALEFMKPNDTIDYTYSNSRLKEMESGYIKTKNSEDNNIMNTITTNADSFGVCVEDNLKRQLCNKLVENGMVEEEDVIRHFYTNNRLGNGEKNMGRIESKEKLCPTLGTRCDCLGVCVNEQAVKQALKKNLRIRKLTPNECFRLQGVTDDDFKNCAVNQSNASLYHLAGDSITTTTLMAIFGTLLDVDWKQKAVEQGLIKVSENDAKQEVQPTLEKFSWDI